MTTTPEHLMVVMPSWIGDIVMATPALRALKEAHPMMRITATIRPGLQPILEGAPFVDAIEEAGFRGLLGPVKDGRRLAKLAPDTALLFPNSPRSALFARVTGSTRRIGYATQGRRWLLTDPINPIKPRQGTSTPTTTLDDYARPRRGGVRHRSTRPDSAPGAQRRTTFGGRPTARRSRRTVRRSESGSQPRGQTMVRGIVRRGRGRPSLEP